MSAMLTSISMADVVDLETAVLHIPKMIRQDEYGYRTSVDGKQVSPLIVIPLHQPFPISKAGVPSSTFTLKRLAAGYYVCSCPAWKFSTERDKMRKTCQHLKDVLGETYENERIALAKEAKSNVFEHSKFRRTISDGHHARHSHAKTVLDHHFRQLSQSQPEPCSSQPNKLTPAVSESQPAHKSTNDMATRPRNTSLTVSNTRSTTTNIMQDESDTETEEEEAALIKPVPSHRAQKPASNSTPEVPTVSACRTRPAFEDSDDDNYGLNPDDVQMSPSKRARRGQKSAFDNDDDSKVSLLLAKSWLLDADPVKPRSKAMDPTGWWVSEKLDGVRAFWDGQRLYSRQKIEWNAPTWWKNRLPKDITLDGELWMQRGTFEKTSQICRTTVRLGRLRTFSHFLERDSMERQWLREQVGGRIASQDRLRAERSAARGRGVAENATPNSSTAVSTGWKAWKGSVLNSSTAKSKLKRLSKTKPIPAWRFAVASSFLRALFGRSAGSSSSSFASEIQASRLRGSGSSLKRCSRCGKMIKRKPAADIVGSACADVRSTLPAQEERPNADQFSSESPLPSAPADPTRMREPIPCAKPTSPRRPNTNPMLDTSRSGRSHRMIPSTYTHVCRLKSKSSNEWHSIKFMVFDAPSLGSRPVEERWGEIEKRFGSTDGLDIDSLEGPQIKLVKHIKCEGRDHLTDLMKSVELKGGEGLMLRQPKSKYEGKRGNTLFKLKSWYDAEAEVIGYADGNGRHEGRTGSLVARMECGTVFRVGTGMSDAMRDNPPPIGTIISYRFFELSEDGYPRFPALRGIARDKSRPKDAVVRPRAGALREAQD